LAAAPKGARMIVINKKRKCKILKKLLTYLKASVMPFLAAFTIIFVVANLFHIIYQVMISIYLGLTQGKAVLTDVARLSEEINKLMSQNILYFISVASVLICGIIFCFWYHVEVRGEQKVDWRSVFHRKNLSYYILLGVGCQFFFSGAMNIIQPMFPKVFEEYGETMEGLLGSNLLLVLLYTLVIAPVSEELIFRGVTLYRSKKVLPFIGANLLQSLFFGIYHQNIIQGIYAAVMGFVLGLVYRKYQTIYAPILLHILINASVFLVMLFPTSILSYIIMTVLGLSLSIYAFISLKLFKLPVHS
jgi:membrane protease YdiL (CAAX protease family)